MPKRENREDFGRQMAAARKIMDEDWLILRALALSDQHPDADHETLLDSTRERDGNRKR